MGRLEGKVTVITGAGSGMGRAMVNLFSQEGAQVVAGEIVDKTLAEVVAEVQAAGGQITGVKVNVADQAQAESLIGTAVRVYGRVDVLCNNAGIMDYYAAVGEVSNEVWERVIGVNLYGPMYLTRCAIPIMRKQGNGSIINTASVAGVEGAAAGVAYTVSKHGLVGLTKNTAWRYWPEGIRCNAIVVGAVQTNIGQSMDPAKLDVEASKRWGMYQQLMPAILQPVDIAHLALFLASDESKMINGALIPADAGWTAA